MQSADEAFPDHKSNKPPRRKLGLAFVLLPLSAIVTAAIGVWYTYTSFVFYTTGERVQATVVRLEESYSSDTGATYSPVYSYTVDGQNYEYESINSSDPPTRRVGETATLLYDPENPAKARENSFWELWLLPFILCPASIFMVVLSIAIPVFIRRMPST
ncbi:MAG: DUF3592 domain-containing protein [Anaerolineales bacterium]|nr:DUF3592 domain-containing protein [Anaerolineales bacterium]